MIGTVWGRGYMIREPSDGAVVTDAAMMEVDEETELSAA
jgi:hypothetical protein